MSYFSPITSPLDYPDPDSVDFSSNIGPWAGSLGTMTTEMQGLVAELNSVYGPWTDILGTVSESGGVPTGAITERGSNANGEYARFADGTQLCLYTGVIDTTVSATTVQEVTWTFPAAFATGPTALVNARSANDATNRSVAARLFGACTTINGASSAVITAYNGDASSRTVRADAFAFGRWF